MSVDLGCSWFKVQLGLLSWKREQTKVHQGKENRAKMDEEVKVESNETGSGKLSLDWLVSLFIKY